MKTVLFIVGLNPAPILFEFVAVFQAKVAIWPWPTHTNLVITAGVGRLE